MVGIFVIIDLEATCWRDGSKSDNEIIELGAILVDDVCNKIGEFQSFVKPSRNPILSEFCKELTSISQQDIDGASDFPTVLGNFISWIERTARCRVEDVIFCSWGYYDKKQLLKDCKQHAIRFPFSVHRSLKHEFARRRNIKPPGLKRALKLCGLEYEGIQHRALDDARNIFRLFSKEKMANW